MKYYNIKIVLLGIVVMGLFIFASPTPINNLKKSNNFTYQIDTSKSSVQWKSLAHTGNIKINNGSISVTANRISNLDIDINMKSINNTDIENKLLKGTLENVLKSPDFFDVEAFPEAHFRFYSAEKINKNKYHISGDFVLFDSEICTNFIASLEIKGDTLFFETEKIAIDRTDWGIFYLSKNNLFPKEEEDNMEVPDTLYITSKIIAFQNLSSM